MSLLTLTAEDKIMKAKLQIRETHTFFFGLGLYLKPQEGTDSMGVDGSDALYYDKDFVEKHDASDLKTVIVHEILHLALNHCKEHKPNKAIDNIAKDIVINNILNQEGFGASLTRLGGYNPSNDEITVELTDKNGRRYSTNIKDISKKTWSQIYSELPDIELKEKPKGQMDDHSKQGGSTGESDQESKRKWNARLQQASIQSKGNMSAALKRLVTELCEPEVEWNDFLRDKIVGYMITNFTWSKPSKAYYSLGIYLPGYTKESFKILVHIDTSGSIGIKDFNKFMTEIFYIYDSHQDVEVTLLIGDSKLKEVVTITTQDRERLLDGSLMKGGGGTSHQFVFDWINDNNWNGDVLISFTDGYSDIPKCWNKYNPSFNTVFIFNNTISKCCYDYGEVVIIS